jgi:hypothetical protein
VQTDKDSARAASKYPREFAVRRLLLQVAAARFPGRSVVMDDLSAAKNRALRSLRVRVRSIERTELRPIFTSAVKAIVHRDVIAMHGTLMAYAPGRSGGVPRR